MSTPSHPTGGIRRWPTDKLTALRLGRRLVTELPTSRPGRRAFVDITPVVTAVDTEARTYTLQHWDYAAGRLDGFDYDIGAILIKTVTVIGELDLTVTVETWQLHPEQFLYPWQTDDPK